MWNSRTKTSTRFEGTIISGLVCLGVCSGTSGAEAETLNIFVFLSSHRDEALVAKSARFPVCEEAE